MYTPCIFVVYVGLIVKKGHQKNSCSDDIGSCLQNKEIIVRMEMETFGRASELTH